MRYLRIATLTTVCVVVLTAAQYGSVHLLSGRPATWLFEASLDLGPPLLFVGDLAQFMLANGSQAPLRDQPSALAIGLLVNVSLYCLLAVLATWLFFRRSPSDRGPA